MVRQSAEVENNMNSIERIVHYANEVEQEALFEIPEAKPKAPWPAEGRVEIKDVFLKYRPGLPLVLKGISMNIRSGEKIGIVGRLACLPSVAILQGENERLNCEPQNGGGQEFNHDRYVTDPLERRNTMAYPLPIQLCIDSLNSVRARSSLMAWTRLK